MADLGLMGIVLSGGGATGINLDVADAIVDLVTKVLELFTVFPLNIFLGASLVGIGVGVYRALKRS